MARPASEAAATANLAPMLMTSGVVAWDASLSVVGSPVRWSGDTWLPSIARAAPGTPPGGARGGEPRQSARRGAHARVGTRKEKWRELPDSNL